MHTLQSSLDKVDTLLSRLERHQLWDAASFHVLQDDIQPLTRLFQRARSVLATDMYSVEQRARDDEDSLFTLEDILAGNAIRERHNLYQYGRLGPSSPLLLLRSEFT